MLKFKAETVVIAPDGIAQGLIKRGMVQQASVDPEPTSGTAIAATTKGKSWLQRNG